MEKKKVNANFGFGVNVDAAMATNVNKDEHVFDAQSNHFGVALRGELKDPELTGSDTLDIKFELPFGGRLEIKATSNVTSSVLAQEVINEQARKNMEQLSSFLATAAMAIAPAIQGISETMRAQKALDKEFEAKARREDVSLDMEIEDAYTQRERKRELENIQHDYAVRALRKQLEKELETGEDSFNI